MKIINKELILDFTGTALKKRRPRSSIIKDKLIIESVMNKTREVFLDNKHIGEKISKNKII